jgi:hypothetical protein
MKLAEALILRADCQKRLEQLKQRAIRVAKVQEGNEPAENPAALLQEIERIAGELVNIIQRINATNSSSRLEEGMALSDAIAQRDVIRLKHVIYRDLAQAATVTQDRYTKSEVRFMSTVNVAELQGQADALAKAHRELDTKIQEANWQIELRD